MCSALGQDPPVTLVIMILTSNLIFDGVLGGSNVDDLISVWLMSNRHLVETRRTGDQAVCTGKALPESLKYRPRSDKTRLRSQLSPSYRKGDRP